MPSEQEVYFAYIVWHFLKSLTYRFNNTKSAKFLI